MEKINSQNSNGNSTDLDSLLSSKKRLVRRRIFWLSFFQFEGGSNVVVVEKKSGILNRDNQLFVPFDEMRETLEEFDLSTSHFFYYRTTSPMMIMILLSQRAQRFRRTYTELEVFELSPPTQHFNIFGTTDTKES